jgi:hypothetical protein
VGQSWGGGLGNSKSRDMCDRVEVVVLGIARSRDMCLTELGGGLGNNKE